MGIPDDFWTRIVAHAWPVGKAVPIIYVAMLLILPIILSRKFT